MADLAEAGERSPPLAVRSTVVLGLVKDGKAAAKTRRCAALPRRSDQAAALTGHHTTTPTCATSRDDRCTGFPSIDASAFLDVTRLCLNDV